MNKWNIIRGLLFVLAFCFPLIVIKLIWWNFSNYSLWLFQGQISDLWLIIQSKTIVEILMAFIGLLAVPYSVLFALIWYFNLLMVLLNE